MASNIIKLFVFAFLIQIVVSAVTGDVSHRGSGRMVGGIEADIIDFNYAVSIQWFRYHLCGGVIITENHILTSFRCIRKFGASELKVLAGTSSRNGYTDEGAVEVEVQSINAHPDYGVQNFVNDIAVVLLKTPLTFGSTIGKIGFYEYPLEEDIPSYLASVAVGWGVLIEGASTYPIKLHEMPLVTYYMSTCHSDLVVYNRELDDKSMFCAGPDRRGDFEMGVPCTGDFGGPLVAPMEDGPPLLVGIASWGVHCSSGYPVVYTNIPRMKDFIMEIINGK